jgi:hypothetical protein
VQVWGYDVSKQAFAAAAAHGCGMLWAVLMATYTEEGASECAWYMVVFSLDTTLGVAVALYLHSVATAWAKRVAASPAFPLPLIHTACVLLVSRPPPPPPPLPSPPESTC